MYWIVYFFVIFPTWYTVMDVRMPHDATHLRTEFYNHHDDPCLIIPILPREYRKESFWVEPKSNKVIEMYQEFE